MSEENPVKINEDELMEYYNLRGSGGRISLRLKFTKTWIFHKLAYPSAYPGWAIKMQEAPMSMLESVIRLETSGISLVMKPMAGHRPMLKRTVYFKTFQRFMHLALIRLLSIN